MRKTGCRLTAEAFNVARARTPARCETMYCPYDSGAVSQYMSIRTTGSEPYRLLALNDFRASRRWLLHDLGSYILDSLQMQEIREANLFETPVLETKLAEHFGGLKDHHETESFALDVALAHLQFYR